MPVVRPYVQTSRTTSFQEMKRAGNQGQDVSLENQADKIDYYLAHKAAAHTTAIGSKNEKKIIGAIEEEKTEDEEESSRSLGHHRRLSHSADNSIGSLQR